jgi:hypothetical protein
MYGFTLSLTSAMRMVGRRQAPAALPQGMTRYPFCRRLGGYQGRTGRVQKISPTPEFAARTLQAVVSRLSSSGRS